MPDNETRFDRQFAIASFLDWHSQSASAGARVDRVDASPSQDRIGSRTGWLG